ncbi:hypothetical protein PILCRDRAFT_498696 [Piloderma croceum F 1598]|uniref:Uncharacterized protein n=1 Tax=Piloderma croceum (strain F 1598) TaxID=765440 RepID=A0A0C3FRC8_PILCF|nr:hypothetical protein PILCRDRAFT_498696 [Piloderma croceum F 1598]
MSWLILVLNRPRLVTSQAMFAFAAKRRRPPFIGLKGQYVGLCFFCGEQHPQNASSVSRMSSSLTKSLKHWKAERRCLRHVFPFKFVWILLFRLSVPFILFYFCITISRIAIRHDSVSLDQFSLSP